MDTPAPIVPKVEIVLKMDVVTGDMEMALPADSLLAAKMLSGAMSHVLDQQIKARQRKAAGDVQMANAGLLRALPTNGRR